MSLHQLRVFASAVIRGFMPLGVAQEDLIKRNGPVINVIRGFMPLGVAQRLLPVLLKAGKKW